MSKKNKLESKLCDCGKGAKWLYMASSNMKNPYCCEDCVPRGCSCNERSVNYGPTVEDGVEGKDWIWVEKGVTWTSIDNKGRMWPCAEFEYDSDEDNFKTFN